MAVILLLGALWTIALAPRRSASLPSSIYRGYLAGRQSGAILYSIVQAVGSSDCEDAQRPPAAQTNPT